ncbi:MAG: pyridoxamine 5'-phosphate oxidase family protein [Candidatus Nitrosopolaris sp.]
MRSSLIFKSCCWIDESWRKKRIIRDPIVKFFRGNNFAFLGTLNKDGSPQVTPTWIDIVEDEGQELILINTARDRIKQKNVSRDPRVSISVVENPYSMITIKGRDS